MGLLDLFKKNKSKQEDDDDDEMVMQVMSSYECVLGAYYQNRDEDGAWPLTWLSENDPVDNLEELSENLLPDYFEVDEEGKDAAGFTGVMYISPERTGIKTLNKNDLKNEFGLIMSVFKKAASELQKILVENDALEEDVKVTGYELGTGRVQPEAILIPDSNIVLLHVEIGLKYNTKM